jgi:hypothetical protein
MVVAMAVVMVVVMVVATVVAITVAEDKGVLTIYFKMEGRR